MGMILSGEITSALTTFAGLGLALILEGDGAERVRLGWTDAAEPQMVVTADGYDDEAIAVAVHEHATARAVSGSWIDCNLQAAPWNGNSALFSPRVKAPQSLPQWRSLQTERLQRIDHEVEDKEQLKRDIDLELIGALGEPAYWRFANNGPRPDEGANRWEMKTRNRGEDFIRNRLRQLAQIVADRDASAIASGLIGQSVKDEAYKGKRSDESRTATGLTSPRFTDSALAWCALWGISSFPVIHRLMGASVTAGAVPIGKFTPMHLVLPVLVGAHTLGRWQAVVVSEQVIQAATSRESAAAARSACAWLAAHGARATLTFQVNVSDNPNAPERSLGAGRLAALN